jgi:hypothetical protein
MAAFTTKRLVRCPASQAAHRLAQFFGEHGTTDGRLVRLTLCVTAPPAGAPGEAGLSKEVIASFASVRTNDTRFPQYDVRWKPEGGGPYPTFAGHLSVDPDDDYDSFLLRLAGDYEAPFGFAGAIFDVTAGRRIAKATVRTLLGTIADSVEQHFQADERRKPSYHDGAPVS